jgi:hypothetical protein
MSMGNYYYLTKLKDDPHVVANYLKKILKYMGEPLCTFKLYSSFRELSGKLSKELKIIDVKSEEKKDRLKLICQKLPIINRNTFIFLIKFLFKVIEQSEHNTVSLFNLN